MLKKLSYGYLSENYKTKKGVTVDNVYDNIYDLNNKYSFIPLEMKADEGFGIDTYLVHGEAVCIEENNIGKQDLYIIVNMDNENKLFSIEPIQETVNSIDEIKYTPALKIQDNTLNRYNENMYDERFSVMQKFQNIRLLNIAEPDLVYDVFLDDEYKKKFADAEEYKLYLAASSSRYNTMQPDEYSSKQEGDKLIYRVSDTNNLFMEFTQTKPEDLKVKLDLYTVLDSDTMKKYNGYSSQGKAQICIGKWIEMINYRDYWGAFNAMDIDFRTEKFGDIQGFIEFAQEYFPDQYEVQNTGLSGNYEEKAGVSTQYVNIVKKQEDENSLTQETVATGNVNVVFGEGMNFAMSFTFLFHTYE